MYIKKITLKNYRNYLNTEIFFNENLNVIIGPNNTGKTNLLKAISYLSSSSDLINNINDFNKNYLISNIENCKRKSPIIEIQYDIEHYLRLDVVESSLSRMKDFLWYDDRLETDSETKNEYFINSSIKLKFELDPRYVSEYLEDIDELSSYEYKDLYKVLEKNIKNYHWNFYNAYTNELITEKKKVYRIFDIDFIEAKRNIEKITDNTKTYINSKIKEKEIKEFDLRNKITEDIKTGFEPVTNQINDDINADQDKIGIINGKNLFVSSFDFDTPFSSYFKYELKNEEGDYILPIDNNGLGYNNLIFIRNIINQKKQSDYNLLLIEEPEAHLHPNMQYKLLKYLSELKEIKTDVGERTLKNQIFITTHSPNITASTNLDDMLLLDYAKNESGILDVTSINIKSCFKLDNYLGEIKSNENITNKEETYSDFKIVLSRSKKHVSKFLDVTRSDMLFSHKTIFVEGVSEKLLLPTFVRKIYKKDYLIDNYISIVELGGINFKYFYPLAYKQKRKFLCITDTDYKYFEKDNKLKFKSLNQFKLCKDTKIKEMKPDEYRKLDNIEVVTQIHYGSTFEKELFIDNWHNKKTIKQLFCYVSDDKLYPLTSLGFSYSSWKYLIELNEKLSNDLLHLNTNTTKMIKKVIVDYEEAILADLTGDVEMLFFAEVFYKYAKRMKGDLALFLATDESIDLNVPEYIQKGIEWLFKDE